MGWDSKQNNDSDTGGCCGCLVLLTIGIVIIEYWIPVLCVVGASLVVFIVYKLVVILSRKQHDGLAFGSREATSGCRG